MPGAGRAMGMIKVVGLVLHPRRDCGSAIDAIVAWANRREVTVLGLHDEINRIDAIVWLDGPRSPDRVQGEARELFLEMNRIAIEADEPGERREDAQAWGRLGEITVPTLLMIGDLDLQYLKDHAAHAAASIPNSRLVELAGVAHLPHLEADEKTLSEIAAFVAECVAGN